MNKLNVGCGPDLKDGWVNADLIEWPGAELWDITQPVPDKWRGKFDYALVNHVLCLLSYSDVEKAVVNLWDSVAEGGTLEIIDMDTLRAFKNFEEGIIQAFPGFEGPIESRLCKHLVGHGRKSLWTPYTMKVLLTNLGFKKVKYHYTYSEHDLRPLESFIVKVKGK